MIGDGGHGKGEVGKSEHNGMKYGYSGSHKVYALIGDLDSLQIGSNGGSSTY